MVGPWPIMENLPFPSLASSDDAVHQTDGVGEYHLGRLITRA